MMIQTQKSLMEYMETPAELLIKPSWLYPKNAINFSSLMCDNCIDSVSKINPVRILIGLLNTEF